jgi:Methyltransferase domain
MALETLPCFAGPPLPWSEWAMRPSAIALLVDEIRLGRRAVVELGSGVSTIVLARAARELEAHLVSIEHDREWAARIRAVLGRERLSAAEVIHVPIAPLDTRIVGEPLSAPGFRAPQDWYEAVALRDACPREIELLVVDGPPAADSPDVLTRSPAVPALGDRLADGCTVALDDVFRRGERRIAELWPTALGCELELPPGTDLAVLRTQLARRS